MENCNEKPSNEAWESGDNHLRCYRIKGHGDGLHISHDPYANNFCTWKIDYDCDCPQEIECENCIKCEAISKEEMLAWLNKDFGNQIPTEVSTLIESVINQKTHS